MLTDCQLSAQFDWYQRRKRFTMEKRLYKNTQNKILCGVCSGIADYLNVDATLVRLATALLILTFGSGLLLYIIAAIIMPAKPDSSSF